MAFPTLVLGDFDLTDWSGMVYNTSVIAEGSSRGAPVPIDVAVKSWLQDGSIVVTQGYDNREVTLRVRMRGPDLLDLAECEAALFAELGKPNLLTWTPPDGYGPPSVFVVITSSMEESPGPEGDLAEQSMYPWRTYNLRLACEAFVRSVDETVTEALPTAGATTTPLDAMSATTGWTGSADGSSATVTNSSGANSVTLASVPQGVHTLAMQKTFAATTTSTKLLMVDWKPSVAGGSLVAIGDGVTLPLMADGTAATAGYKRSYYLVAAASLAVTRFEWTYDLGIVPIGAAPTLTLSLDALSVTDVNPTFGTGRQQQRALTVIGSARTPGALAIESPTAALGDDVLVYAYPDTDSTFGYAPSLRQYRTAGNTVTSDSSRVSGSREPLSGSGITFAIPMGLFPAGSYVFLARIASSSGSATGTLTHTTQTTIGSNNVGPQTLVTSEIVSTTTYATLVLAQMQLPTADLDFKTAASLSLNLRETIAPIGGGFLLDEAWLFNTTIGQLVWVDCGTGSGAAGGASRRLFLEPASPTIPRPTLRVGHSADRSDSYHPVGAVKSWQSPQFSPGQTNVLWVTPNATDAVGTLRSFPRWHTHAAI